MPCPAVSPWTRTTSVRASSQTASPRVGSCTAAIPRRKALRISPRGRSTRAHRSTAASGLRNTTDSSPGRQGPLDPSPQRSSADESKCSVRPECRSGARERESPIRGIREDQDARPTAVRFPLGGTKVARWAPVCVANQMLSRRGNGEPALGAGLVVERPPGEIRKLKRPQTARGVGEVQGSVDPRRCQLARDRRLALDRRRARGRLQARFRRHTLVSPLPGADESSRSASKAARSAITRGAPATSHVAARAHQHRRYSREALTAAFRSDAHMRP